MQICFNSSTFEGFPVWICLTWSLQNLNVPFFFEPFRGGPEWCCSFGILLKNSIICSSISYAMSLSWSQAAKRPQTISTPTSCFTVGMMFCEIVKNVLVLCQMQWDVKPSKKFTFCLVSPQNIFLKNLGDRQDVFFFDKCQTILCGGVWWNSPVRPWIPLSQFLINTELNWGKGGLQFFI